MYPRQGVGKNVDNFIFNEDRTIDSSLLSARSLSSFLQVDPEIHSRGKTHYAPFQLRRRSVETKIVLGSSPPEIDETLIRNIANGIGWYGAIKNGTTFEELATREGSSVRRIQAVTNLAFLSPVMIDCAVNGTLPHYITTDYLLKKGFPSWRSTTL